MRRGWLAGLSSLILHTGALAAIWQILSAPADQHIPVVVELRPPVVERLPLVRVSTRERGARAVPRPAEIDSPPPPAPKPARKEIETDTPSPPPSQAPSAGFGPVLTEAGAGLQNEPPGRFVDVASTRPAGASEPIQMGSSPPSRPSNDGEASGGTGDERARSVRGPDSTLSAVFALSHPSLAPDEGGFLKLLRSRVQAALVYPPPAVRRGLSGMVELEVRLTPDGSVEAIRVAKSSGHAILDQAAVRTVEGAAPFSLPDRRPLVVVLPIAFELR